MVRLKMSLFLVVLLSLVLAACGPAGGQPGSGTTAEEGLPDTGAKATQVLPEMPEGIPDAAREAQRRIGENLGLSLEQVEIVSATQVDWNDACLELAGPDEVCAQVVTPGWHILIRAGGLDYDVRTDEMGTQVRWMQKIQTQADSLSV